MNCAKIMGEVFKSALETRNISPNNVTDDWKLNTAYIFVFDSLLIFRLFIDLFKRGLDHRAQ